MKLIIINGPNLNLLGTREPEIYGLRSFEDYFKSLLEQFPGIHLDSYQSNVEGEIINKLHEAAGNTDGIILNAAAYTHTSVAIGDAIKAIKTPVVEVHISNTHSREEFRRVSYISPHARGIITGFGLDSYKLAILSFVELKA